MSVENIFNKFPVLEVNDEYYLRQITYEDAQDYLDYISNKQVNQYVPDECLPKDLDQAKNEIKYNLDLFLYKRSIFWSVTRKKDNKVIGSCGFNYWSRDHNRAEISYDLNYDFWNKGIMTDVVKSVLAFAFTQMKLQRVEATVNPNNMGSLKVLRKCNFKKEGVLREHKLLHGKFTDAIILSLIKREYFNI